MLIKPITLFRLRALSDFLFAFCSLIKIDEVCHFKTKYWHTSDFLPTVLVHLRHKLCLSEYSRSRSFWHILCVFDRLDAPEAQSLPVRFGACRRVHTHFSLGNSVSRGLCFQRFIIKHVPQFSNSKDGILQQSPIELILMLSLGFKEERVRNAVKGKKLR